MSVVELKNFSFTYAGAQTKALSGISLDVSGGEFILLCGKSGCGKTTLLRNLKKEIRPQGDIEGSLRICGLDELTPQQSASLVGFVMQDPDNQTVMDSVWMELAFGLENLGIPSEEIGRRIGEISAFFGIDSWFAKKTSELSGGQKQILSLAAVIAMQAEIIVLDEPTAQLDPIAAKEFLHMLMRVNTELGKTVIISEHLLEEVFSMADRILYMEGGGIKYLGSGRGFVETLSPDDAYYSALPSPARLARRLNAQETPLDVREGRKWLIGYESLRSLRCRETLLHESASSRTAAHHAAKSNLAINAKGLWFRYSKQEDFVLKGLDTGVKKNTIHLIVGGNGSGKSTLLRLLAGIRKPIRGKVAVSESANLIMLPQDTKAAFTRDSLREEFAGDIASPYIERLGLSDLLHRHPYDLSAGEMQKAAIAKALVKTPDILLLDEPTKGLDAFARAEIGRILLELKADGKTVVAVTHDIEFAAAFGDRCSMIFAGGIIAEDDARYFFGNNMFYTTAINRMTRGLVDSCILESDIEEVSASQ